MTELVECILRRELQFEKKNVDLQHYSQMRKGLIDDKMGASLVVWPSLIAINRSEYGMGNGMIGVIV